MNVGWKAGENGSGPGIFGPRMAFLGQPSPMVMPDSAWGRAVGGDSAQEGQTFPLRRDAGSAAALPSWQAPQRAFSVAWDPTPAWLVRDCSLVGGYACTLWLVCAWFGTCASVKRHVTCVGTCQARTKVRKVTRKWFNWFIFDKFHYHGQLMFTPVHCEWCTHNFNNVFSSLLSFYFVLHAMWHCMCDCLSNHVYIRA